MFKNLTPHAINVLNSVFQPSGEVARVSEVSEFVCSHEGIDLVTKSFGKVIGLPEPEEGIFLIVSGMVRASMPERKDLVSPGDQIRDSEGKIIGVKNFVCN